MSEPLLDCELALALTDQLTVLPLIDAAAQGTSELAEGGAQSAEFGVTQIDPDDPTAPILRLVLLNA